MAHRVTGEPGKYRIGVPTPIAEAVLGIAFTCELTADGILFRPIMPTLPAWVLEHRERMPREGG